MISLSSLALDLPSNSAVTISGRVTSVSGCTVIARIPRAALGDMCQIELRNGSQVDSQVIAFNDDSVTLAPFDNITGIIPGAKVISLGHPPTVTVSDQIVGSVVDALGIPIDPKFKVSGIELPIFHSCPSPLDRTQIDQPLETGVSVIDGLLTIGYGQRIGLFAGAGVGKSTLFGMIARNAQVDLCVIALVGERGREVGDFIRESLGPAGLEKSILVVATSDESPIRRTLAASTATTIAEYFRDRGQRVLLLVDSLTRMARAVRDVSLSAGEMPVRQGYTPSVYTALPQLLERAGTNARGSISAIYTVLTNSNLDVDPLSEEIKSILDGHLVLDQSIARDGIRPAIDPLNSVSRLIPKLHRPNYIAVIDQMLSLIAQIYEAREIQNMGGSLSAPLIRALQLNQELKSILHQSSGQSFDFKTTIERFNQFALRVGNTQLETDVEQ